MSSSAILKPLKHPEIAKQKSINDKLQTVGSSMLAFGAELSSIIMEDMKGERAPTGSFELNEITSMHVQSKITRRIFEESKEKGERNSVIERLRCDGYDKAVGPTKLYLSTTKRFLEEVDGGVDEVIDIYMSFFVFNSSVMISHAVSCLNLAEEYRQKILPENGLASAVCRRSKSAW